MNNINEKVDAYLNEVRHHLEPLSDKEQILKELKAHIWDLAHEISSSKEGLTIQDGFDQALLIMEDPKTLASKFIEEESNIIPEWKTPLKTPESKVQNEQFIILAAVGFAAVILIAMILQIVTNDPFVSLISFTLGIAGTAFFILTLYISDEKSFKEQVAKMREAFQKSYEEIKLEFDRKRTPVPKKAMVEFQASETPEIFKEPGFWGAFGQHLGGVISGFFISLFIAFLIYLEISGILIFNENWYIISGMALYFSLFTDIAYSAFLVIFGRIRLTRLASAGQNIISGLSGIVLTVYYPFTITQALTSTLPSDIVNNPDFAWILTNADVGAQVIIGIVVVISFLSALYDVFKFGAWKSSDRKSLI
ncbi:MAG: hypothetical protein ACXAC6_09950 [Candidatus Hodarchaeales archaeon]|jgi:hypothetical protein